MTTVQESYPKADPSVRETPQNPNPTATEGQQKPNPRVRTKCSIACNFCRIKKIRCNGADPCTNCVDRGQVCVSSTRRRSRAKDKDSESNAMAERLARVEALIQVSKAAHPSPPVGYSAPGQDFNSVMTQGEPGSQVAGYLLGASPLAVEAFPPSPSLAPPPADPTPIYRGDMNSPDVANPSDMTNVPAKAQSWFSPVISRPQLQESRNSGLPTVSPIGQPSLPPTFSPPSSFDRDPRGTSAPPASYCPSLPGDAGSSPDEIREGASISSSETSNWEYHGPRSFLSICSKPGIQWVAERTGSSSFHEAASTFTTDITRRLKIERQLSRERKPEPDPETAWRYTRAYFDKALDAAFGIVHRPWFESRLKAHLNGSSNNDDDPTWYALRNIIYASGCRIELSHYTSFREANQSAWGWFENALAVHTELLYFRTSLIGVQALTLMAYFTENLGSPCLEYMLCTNALRLAISKGLHRQAVSSWNLTEHEHCHRSWLFWAAYCLEKHIVSRSGRPSIIDDDDINCQVPTTAPPGSTVNAVYCNILIRLAQLSSLAAKRLSSVQAFRQRPEILVGAVSELDEELTTLKRSIEPILCLGSPLDLNKLPMGMSLQQTIYLQYAYFNTVFDIHTVLTYPWSQSILGLAQHSTLRSQVERSIHVVAEACREAILATKYIHVDASTPVPLTFFGPMYAIINLFIFILQNPDHSRVRSDLALMDIGAGHFARLEFATDSEISIPFVKEMAALARDAIRYARSPSSQQLTKAAVDMQSDLAASLYAQGTVDATTGQMRVNVDSPFKDVKDGFVNNSFDLELENWSTLLPMPGFDDMADFLVP